MHNTTASSIEYAFQLARLKYSSYSKHPKVGLTSNGNLRDVCLEIERSCLLKNELYRVLLKFKTFKGSLEFLQNILAPITYIY